MAVDPSEGEGRTPESRRVGHTPLLHERSLSPSPLVAPSERSRLRRVNIKGFLLKQVNKTPPLVQEHLTAVIEGAARACRSWVSWLVVAILTLLLVQSTILQRSADLETVRLKPQKQRSIEQLEIEGGIDNAYRQWKVLQEANPAKFGNFSKFLMDTKNKESHLRKKLSALGEESMKMLSNIVVPPAGKRPVYTKEEEYELLWSYLMPEKSWPYVGSERWLEEFRNDTRGYYNSLAVFPHNNRTRMHGLAGIWPNGTRAWIPSPMPPPIAESPLGKEEELKDGGFYLKLSNALGLDREVPDLRPDFCRKEKFDITTLEDVSVVIVYYNEHLSTLLRSIHSVLNNTPPPLLREIILVDDHSNATDVASGGFLDEYVKLLPKTKILRLPERRGIVQGRMAGAKIAKAPIFVILDSHIEVNVGWLEPQIKRLMESPKSVVFPRILGIDPETFKHRTDSGIGCFLSFKWMMQERPYFDEVKSAEPVASPSMAGGLFAVRRDWFFDIGGYDDEMKMWGAENVEMGFRYWQCGGRVECMPCSYTYHIYRKGGTGYKSPGEYIAKNRIRTAMVWTDKYYQLVREFLDLSNVDDDHDSTRERKEDEKTIDLGSFEKMKALKKRLQCKSFDWFLRNVDPKRASGSNWTQYGIMGELRSVGNKDVCIDSLQNRDHGKPFGHYRCHGSRGSQGWFTARNQIRNMANENLCLSKQIKLTFCESPEDDARWTLDKEKGWIMWAKTKEALSEKLPSDNYDCLGFDDQAANLTMRECKHNLPLIQWNFADFVWDPEYHGPPQMYDPEYDPYEFDDLPFPDQEKEEANKSQQKNEEEDPLLPKKNP